MSTILTHPAGLPRPCRLQAVELRDAAPVCSEAASASLLAAWKRDLGLIALLMLMPLVFFTGAASSDDFGYLYCARFGEAAGRSAFPQFALRFMHWGPLALLLRLLPGQAWVMCVGPLVSMVVTLLVIGRLARRWLGIQRAWVPVVLFGLVPVNVIMATVAMPDLAAAAWAWLGIALCCPCLLERDQPRAVTRCIAGGLLIAISYNAKETGAILVPSLGLFVLLYRTREAWAWQRVALICVGAGAWVIAETTLFWHWTSDPLYHSHALALAEHNYYGRSLVQPTWSGLLAYGGEYLRWLADPRLDYGPVGPLLLAGLLIAVARRRDTVSGLLACLVLPGLLYLSMGSSSLSAYQPLGHHPRYLLPVLPGMALAAGVAIDRLWSSRSWLRMPMTAVTAGVVAASLIATNNTANRWYYAATFRAGQSLIAEHATAHGGAGLHASVLSRNRFEVPAEWLGGVSVTKISRPPASAEEWVARYGGAYVLLTAMDRHPARKPAHAQRTLYGESAEALRGFTRVARREPPQDRLSEIVARLRGRECPTKASEAVEIYQVPASGPAD